MRRAPYQIGLTMLKKFTIGIGIATSLWFMTAAIAGWKSPKIFSGGGGRSGRGGGYFGGGWSGGK